MLDRVEFLAVDLNASGDSTDLNEGLFRIYTARNSNDAVLRGDFPSSPQASNVSFCGDWHMARLNGAAGTAVLQFYPAIVHNTTWFNGQMKQGLIDGGTSSSTATTQANNEQAATLQTIMSHQNARCYLPGDEHLVAVERSTNSRARRQSADWKRVHDGRHPEGRHGHHVHAERRVYGSWKLNTNTPNATINA